MEGLFIYYERFIVLVVQGYNPQQLVMIFIVQYDPLYLLRQRWMVSTVKGHPFLFHPSTPSTYFPPYFPPSFPPSFLLSLILFLLPSLPPPLPPSLPPSSWHLVWVEGESSPELVWTGLLIHRGEREKIRRRKGGRKGGREGKGEGGREGGVRGVSNHNKALQVLPWQPGVE